MIEEGEEDIYDRDYRDDMSDNDEINPREQAFMLGYGDAL